MTMKIYTKTGDDGTTALFGGRRVPKHDMRIEAYGTVDELNSVLGVALSAALPDEMRPDIERLSAMLLTVGADLATPLSPPPRYAIPRVTEDDVLLIEHLIDEYESELEPLQNFILPGGTPAAAHLHLARTVCRRAERATVALAGSEDIGPVVAKFLNRLSDFLFVAARRANHLAGVGDIAWTNPALNRREKAQP